MVFTILRLPVPDKDAISQVGEASHDSPLSQDGLAHLAEKSRHLSLLGHTAHHDHLV